MVESSHEIMVGEPVESQVFIPTRRCSELDTDLRESIISLVEIFIFGWCSCQINVELIVPMLNIWNNSKIEALKLIARNCASGVQPFICAISRL